MQEDSESSPVWNEDEPPRSEARAFSHDELVDCEKCKRVNPPTRTSCLYCGAALPVSDTAKVSIRPTLRQLDDWELGFNAIHVPDESAHSGTELRKISELLRLEFDDVQAVVTAGIALPLARCSSPEEAELVLTRLASLGVSVVIVSDTDLDSYTLNRVRTIDLNGDSLVVYPTGREGKQAVPWEDITLIVVGRRIVRRLEVAERPDKRRGKEVVSSRELSTDAERLDIYSNQVQGGWRIAADNFDFSCLKGLKTLLASKNFQILTEELRRRAVRAEFDDSYLRVRHSLSLVWPLEQRTESMGLHKPRMGRINMGAATTSDNELQFTRYSRLLNYLKLRANSD